MTVVRHGPFGAFGPFASGNCLIPFVYITLLSINTHCYNTFHSTPPTPTLDLVRPVFLSLYLNSIKLPQSIILAVLWFSKLFLDNKKEYPALTSKEATTAYYKVCSSSVCDHNDKNKHKATQSSQKFDEDAY